MFFAPHPDRLFPADPGVRAIARRLHAEIADLPIISPHGHVDAALLLADQPFPDPTSLLIAPDHYVFRLLHASGVPLDELGVGQGHLDEAAARRAWRHFCAHWTDFRGTPVQYWLQYQLAELFGVRETPTAARADVLFDEVSDALAQLRPRELYEQFRLEVLATTDDPCADLAAHAALAADPTWSGRVIPTFRPDRFLEVGASGFPAAVDELSAVVGSEIRSLADFLSALAARRRYFIAHGAVSADHSHVDVGTERLSQANAAQVFQRARRGKAYPEHSVALRRHLLDEMARMSCEDGLVMTLHPGVHRNHHPATAARFGPDSGHDIPVAAEYTQALQPLLDRYGTHPNFHLVLFTLDASTVGREIAPLAGFYPSVFVGAPWWFLDAPDAIRRYQRTITDTVGFTRSSGFVDDTRAFCSIPARHDMSRRLDAAFLAELVAEHRISEEDAAEVARQLVQDNPRRVFKL